MQVSQFNGVKNQFVIESSEGTMFQSYDSPIALIGNDGKVHLSTHWDYSRTTMKHLGRFLSSNAKEIRQKVQNGDYLLDLSLSGEVVK
jgi:hypothetical protein